MLRAALCAVFFVLAACSTDGGAGTASGGGAGASGAASSGGAPPSGGFGGASGEIDPENLLPARVRRLATAEYDASVQALLSTEQAIASAPDFPPDLRQDGFTVNGAQRVDAVSVERFADAADALVSEAQANGTLARLAPCKAGDEATSCARQFIESFGAKVYRRPLVSEEIDALLALYAVGAEDATYEDGIAHVTRGLLQSAGFLYLTELGDGSASSSGLVRMTSYEIASELSYFLTSAPPDDELLAKADSDALSDAAERAAQARRLFQSNPRAQATAVRLVREWLGIDRIDASAKDTLVYPDFEAEKPRIVAESQDFVRAVAFQSTGTISELIGAKWTVNTGPLGMYQAGGHGPIAGSTLVDRVGILNQAAFLASYANAHESHPIFRGVAIARRVVCQHLDSPASFNIQVVPPPPDPSKTTRERFEVHAKDEICAGCHQTIDPLGFAFEHFDGMGGYRTQEHGRDIDSAVVVAQQSDYLGIYADSNQLAAKLAQSSSVRECFARLMYRAAMASGDNAATPGEADFVEFWHSIPAAAQGNIVETLVAVVSRRDFGMRMGL